MKIKIKSSKILYILVFFLMPVAGSYAVQFGSDTAVAVQNVVQTFANGDVLNGFTIFTGGITNSGGAAANARYNNYFPLYGTITMNNGLMNLNRNITFGSNVTFANGAQYNGNGFSLNFPTRTTNFVIPAGTVMGNVTVVVNSPVQLNAVLTFTNNCVIEGNGNIIDCTAGAIAIGAGASLNIQNAVLKGLSNNRFYCYDNNGTVTLEGVTCVLNNTFTFSQGRIDILDNVLFTGAQTFLYSSNRPATIRANSTWLFDSGMTFSYDTTASNLLVFTDATSVLRLYETTLFVDFPGLQLTRGSIILDGACPMINNATSASNGIFLGDGILAANNAVLSILAESGINLTQGFFVNNNV